MIATYATLQPLNTVGISSSRTRFKNNDALSIQQASEHKKKQIFLTDEFSKLLTDVDADSKVKKYITSTLVTYLILTQSEKITFEHTPEDSFLVKASYRAKNYFLAIYFDKEVSEGYECFLNIYNDKMYHSSFDGKLEKVFEELMKC